MKKIRNWLFLGIIIIGYFFLTEIKGKLPAGIQASLQSENSTTYAPPKKVPSDYYGLKIVEQARSQIGIVTLYDNGYYKNAQPPADRGACSDVIIQALQGVNYDLKNKLDTHMKRNPRLYNSQFDQNANVRRVANLDVFFNSSPERIKLEHTIESSGFVDRLPGDIITYEKIPGKKGLWHIGVISDKISNDGVPYIIHNYGLGTKENNMLLKRPSPTMGHYRLKK